ncbi:methyltransferase [Micromonospora sp. RTGN7]|uniref:methyltransferase n=1 Tax=Micromonospora sp. RTGN7 TaxID=3016526 RepID=UPI0029FF4483|nr:methyltransferase [Micromonospora sp. RTGN7]
MSPAEAPQDQSAYERFHLIVNGPALFSAVVTGLDLGVFTLLHRSMAAFTLRTMPGLLDNPEVATVRHLLDVGGGDGTTARAFAERYPSAEVTIFDMPSVTRLVDTPDGDRVRLHPGDLFADPLPVGADAVLFSHVLEVFSGEQIRTLLSKAHAVLPAGGRLFIYGFPASDDEEEGVYSARLSLYLNVLATGAGMTYPVGDYEQWARQAGFGGVSSFTGLPYEHGLVVATKE